MVLSHEEFTAWVTIDGKPVEEYQIRNLPEKKRVECYIPSQAGRNYEVHWRDSRRSTATDGLVVVDGKKCGTKTISPDLDKPDNTYKKGFRTSSNLIVPFQFADIETTDDESRANLPNSPFVGRIELLIYRVKIKEREVYVQQARHEDQIFYEKEVKGLQHCTTFGKAEEIRERPAVGLELLSEVEVARFRFCYRPIETLRAERIAPSIGTTANNPIVILEDDFEEDTKPDGKKEKLEEKLKTTKQERIPVDPGPDVIVISDDEDFKPDRSQQKKRKPKPAPRPKPKHSPIVLTDDEDQKIPPNKSSHLSKPPKREHPSTQSSCLPKPPTAPPHVKRETSIRPPITQSSPANMTNQERLPSVKPRTSDATKRNRSMKPPPVPIRVPTKPVHKPEVTTPRLPPDLVYPKEEVSTPRPPLLDVEMADMRAAKKEEPSTPAPHPPRKASRRPKAEQHSTGFTVKSERGSSVSTLKRKAEEDDPDDEIDDEEEQSIIRSQAVLRVRLLFILQPNLNLPLVSRLKEALARRELQQKRLKPDHPNSCQ
ncbi:hypothetical protein V5O48_003527 [Marasmius crinis-equi]|uniref:DUF7918 domain-containing protein n=1 Tax=Marasmius crinis-equi TaxID=585013 RepID=A0ABR3FT20_9AGAR